MYLTNICGNRCTYCPVRSNVRDPYGRGQRADFATVARNTKECSKLGVRWIEYSGGDVLMLPFLPEILRECNSLGMSSSISLSSSLIVDRTREWGEDWLSLPSSLRFSIDGDEKCHNRNRGNGSYQTIEAGLDAASKFRAPETTQLVFTLAPGPKGNIEREQFESVLSLAKKFQVTVNLNPLFGTEYAGNKDGVDRLWACLTQKEKEDLHWLINQPLINQQSLLKLQLLDNGGNDTDNPTCCAARAVLTISASNRVIMPCCHNPDLVIPIQTSIEAVLQSKEWLTNIDKSGTHDFCSGCMVWCNIVPSWALAYYDTVPEWEKALSGI